MTLPLHQQIGCFDPLGLGFPLTTSTPAIVSGKIHFQQISVTGFRKRPEQLSLEKEKLTKPKQIMKIVRVFFIDYSPYLKQGSSRLTIAHLFGLPLMERIQYQVFWLSILLDQNRIGLYSLALI